MNTKCLNCEASISQVEGKRERLYCSDKCRADFNQKKKRKTVSVEIDLWQSSVIKFVEATDGEWNLSDGRKGTFVWAKDGSKVETVHTYLPPKNDVITPKSETVVEHGNPKNLEELKALCPLDLKGIERSAWISEKRKQYGI